jgi:hypothetical protein
MQPAFKFFELVLEFPFDLWSLSCFVADVDVHRRVPRHWEKIPKEGPQALSMLKILHLQGETRLENSALSKLWNTEEFYKTLPLMTLITLICAVNHNLNTDDTDKTDWHRSKNQCCSWFLLRASG